MQCRRNGAFWRKLIFVSIFLLRLERRKPGGNIHRGKQIKFDKAKQPEMISMSLADIDLVACNMSLVQGSNIASAS